MIPAGRGSRSRPARRCRRRTGGVGRGGSAPRPARAPRMAPVAGGNSIALPYVEMRFAPSMLARRLRDAPCGDSGCPLWRVHLDAERALRRWFGFPFVRAETGGPGRRREPPMLDHREPSGQRACARDPADRDRKVPTPLHPSITGFGRGSSRPRGIEYPEHSAGLSHAPASAATSLHCSCSWGGRRCHGSIVGERLLEPE